MRAVALRQFGGPEVLEVLEMPRPAAGPGEVLVRVQAATVNPTDLALRAGFRRPSLPPPYIPGMELSGVVAELGAGVEGIGIDDEVMAIVSPMRPAGGAQAEFVPVPVASLAPVPRGTPLLEAATLPMNGLTVRRALDLLGLRPGATLAVTGAAGAVGGYAIELGKLLGLRIAADAAPADEELVRSLGADIVVPRGPEMADALRQAMPDGVDAVLDAALLGQAVLPAIRDGGQIAAVRPYQGDTERGIAVRQVMVTDYIANRQALAELGAMAAAGELTLRVAATFPPEQAAEAHRRLQAGGVRGRLVIVF